jgi:predicted transcriptional regulator
MNDYLMNAIELARAQASVRVMTEDEIITIVERLTAKLKGLSEGEGVREDAPAADAPVIDPKKSIKEKSITCLVCGKTMKVLTKKHLALHGLDAVSYREKFGLKKGTPLTCKELQRTRKQKMAEMKLWERRAEKRKIDFGSVEDL